MSSYQEGELLLAEAAASAGSASERALTMLDALRRVVPFDAAWLALIDPLGDGYHSVAAVDLDAATVGFLSGPLTAHDIEVAGADQALPPLSPSDLPFPVKELPTWAECLTPTGIHEALALALFVPAGRPVGFLALLSESRQPPSPATRRRLWQLAPLLAHGIDPMRSLLSAARLVRAATAGVVLRADGGCEALPGLQADALLAPQSPVLAAAQVLIGAPNVCSSFLWPLGGSHAPLGHMRVTVLAAPDDVPSALTAVVLLSPAPDLRGLTARELEVLGLLVEGYSNQQIARTLVVAPRTVAAHVEHILGKLGVPTRTLAAVRAERDGLYVPVPPAAGRDVALVPRPARGGVERATDPAA